MENLSIDISKMTKEEKDRLIIIGRKLAALDGMLKRCKISKAGYLEEVKKVIG